MTEIHTEVLSAFCDGEIVDPDLFAAALADPHGRAALVDFARLRAAVAPAGPLPASLASPRRAPVRFTAWAVTAAAAAMVLMIVAVASLIPRPSFRSSNDQAPPAPSRVLRFEPGVDWHLQGGK
jgi:hypothetical protein